MKHIGSLLLFLAILFALNVSGQIITTEPSLPTPSDSVTIIFNAIGTDLENYTGTIYTHTGVILDGSSSWQHVIGSWGNNATQPKLNRIGSNKYELKISPSIIEYYNVPQTSTIMKMAFVFRNADANKQTVDLFVDVVMEGITVKIVSPTIMETVYELNGEVSIEISSNEAQSLSLFINDSLIKQTNQNIISYQYSANLYGTSWIKAVGVNQTETVYDSLPIFVRTEVPILEIPNGLNPGLNITGANSVTLVLNDPPAKKNYVFAIGDHSNWHVSQDVYMNRTPDGKNFWIEINDLNPNQEYIYQYWIDGELRIADPYTEKTSDPWNDKYISTSNYPDLIKYPQNKTVGIASVFCINPPEYVWQTTQYKAPDKTDLVIYELHIRDFVEGDDIKKAILKLDYLHDLGINAIELMPINEFEGNDSWGYNPSFYFATDKAYGTKNDYKKFIDECHSRGIAVIIDMVLNHSFGQSPFVQMYFDPQAGAYGHPSADNPWYNQICPHEPYCWGHDFNHNSEYTKELIDRINNFWISEFKIDGFRFDFTKGFTNTQTGNQGSNYDTQRISNLKRMADNIWAVKPDTYVILEHFCDNNEEKELAGYRASEGKGMMLWGNMNYNYNEATMGWINSSNFSGISYKSRGWDFPHLIGYMESHDEERLMYKNLQFGNSSNPEHNVKNMAVALERCALGATFFFTIPGPKMIWQFGELGYDISIEHNGRLGRKPIRWDYADNVDRNRLHGVYAKLIHLKKRYPVFSTKNFSIALSGAKKWIKLDDADMKAVVMGNFNVIQEQFDIEFTQTGKWYEFFSQDSILIDNTAQTIQFAPGEYRLYTTQKIISDSVYIVGINNKHIFERNKLKIYPNPTDNDINIEYSTNAVESVDIRIVDLTGKCLLTKTYRTIPGSNIFNQTIPSNIKNGVYFLQLESNLTGTQTVKLVIK